MKPQDMSMVEFYLTHAFNPVFIPVEEAAIWEGHVRKRRNLYERHLGIPLSLLEGRSVLEFGCNSGENGLVLAASGAKLTFVEPNHQVLPRLHELFGRMNLEDQIQAIYQTDLQAFETIETYDIVIAEGFISTLPDRDQVLAKILGLIKPMGFGIISYNDLCGGLLEMLKRAILHRIYSLQKINDLQSEQALRIAEELFLDDFNQLNASRSFETWWRDTMVAPVYTDRQLWSFPDILTVLQAGGAVVHNTSPRWSSLEDFTWYKNAPNHARLNEQFREEWKRHLAYFMTGFRLNSGVVPDLLITDIAGLVRTLSRLGDGDTDPGCLVSQGQSLLSYLRSIQDPRCKRISEELSLLFELLAGTSSRGLLDGYHHSIEVRNAWGTAYHYLCFQKVPPPSAATSANH